MIRIAALIVAVAVAVDGGPSTSPPIKPHHGADDVAVDEAGRAFAAGERAYRQGRFRQAADAFAEAQRLAPHPSTQYNLGLALDRAGRSVEAWHAFEALRRDADDEAQRTEAQQALARVRPKIATVRVLAPSALRVCMDGRPLPPQGNTRQAVTTPGRHDIAWPGGETAVTVSGGETRTVDLELWAKASAYDRAHPRRRGILLGVSTIGTAAAVGLAAGAAVTDDKPVRVGLASSAGAAAGVAFSTALAAWVGHRRARRTRRGRPPGREAAAPRGCPALKTAR